jgi:ketosteroid isomerase-like protein
MVRRESRRRFLGAAGAALVGAVSMTARASNRDGLYVEQTREAANMSPRLVVEHFNEVFARHDADALGALLTDDTVFEDTSPAPDGRRIEGKSAVVEFWRGWFTRNPDAAFDAEDTIVASDRVVVLWTYRKMRNGQPWHLRGVDVFKVRDGKVAAKLAYVKG